MTARTTALAPPEDDAPREELERELLEDAAFVDMILNPEEFCYGVRDGWSDRDWHANPEDYTLDELIGLWFDSEEDCVLHVQASYPAAPVGVVGAQVARAHLRLQEHTEQHTGSKSHVTEDDGHHYYATVSQLRELWEDFPHAQPTYERWAVESTITVHVVEG